MPAPVRFAALALALVAFSGPAAQAIDTCRVKVDKKTGILTFDARNVQGLPNWGFLADRTPSNLFFNNDTCVVEGRARKCMLADPESLEARTPPARCLLYVEDETNTCEAPVPGCVPAVRPVRQAVLTVDATNAFQERLLFERKSFCDNDEDVVGGGYRILSGDEFISIVGSFPNDDDGAEWLVEFWIDAGASAQLQVWALCAR